MKLKEKLEAVAFALGLMRRHAGKIYFYMFLLGLTRCAPPILLTVVSAKIVDIITYQGDFQQAMLLGGLCAVAVAVCYYGDQILYPFYEKEMESLRTLESKLFEEKVVSVDFELLESDDFQNKVKSYRSLFVGNGGVFANICFQLSQLMEGSLSFLFSLIVLFPVLEDCLRIDNSAFLTSWKPLVILAVWSILCAVLLVINGNRMTSATIEPMRAINKRLGRFMYWLEFPKNYHAGKEVHLYRAQPLVRQLSFQFNQAVDQTQHTVNQTLANYQSLQNVIQCLLESAFYLFVALKAWAGAFTVGNFVLFIGSVAQLVYGITLMGQISLMIGMTGECAWYLKQVLETESLKHMGTLPVEKRNDNQYQIEFHHVSFRYPGSSQWALKDVCLRLTIGEHFAVVGMNGSGKTTFIKLLCRLYDPEEGQITLNGVDIRKYDLREYMQIFSVVFQDFQLFSVPLNQNVAASLDVDTEKLWDCLSKSGIRARVAQLPQKEKSVLYQDFDRNGVDISGGEAQKIALARALYKEAPFLILDEPTAALDPIAEYEIYQRFNQFVQGKTAIYISHRLSSCRFCDRILVFDQGRIIQTGSHETLLQDKNGKYHALWYAQAGYYTETACVE